MADLTATADAAPESVTPEDDDWLTMARDAYEQSTDWFDVSLRPTIEKAMAHFNNRHPPGSKYHTESYKFRSKGFRPKTRAAVRRNEAAAAVAFFSTQDMVSVTAENDADQAQVVSASVLGELLNYRLDDSIPWFLTLLGGYQDALNVGVVISHQSWEFDEAVEQYPLFDQAGNPAMGEDGQQMTKEVREVLTDKPRIDLVAIENFRISPASDWADPIGSTPYIVELIPMFIGDVKEKMEAGKWEKYDDGKIASASSTQYDSVRAAREGTKRTDPADVSHATTAFDTVWVHRNIIRKDGEDWIFYTLGTTLRLTEAKLLRKEYRHLARGERPYVMGSCLIEAHKSYTAGLNELTFGLQEAANEIQNQRRDNVSLVMNKRYFAKRTANVDYKSLTRNVPGSITLMDDINTDLKWDSPGEVTGSSYQEQDRVSLDYDELAGTFSPGSVQSNRQLGETVGGMKMLSNDANVITEYQLRVFAETWVEPVLKQAVRLEQAYETDAKVLAIAGERANIQKFGVDQVTDELLQGMVTVRVNVGFGATNPQQRVEKLTMGFNTVAAFAPQVMQGLDAKEVIIEIFGALGYKGAERFFPKLKEEQEDPQVAQLTQMVQQLQQALQGKELEQQGRLEVARISAESRKEVETIRQQGNMAAAEADARHEFDLAKMQATLSTIDKQLEQERNQIEVGRLQNEREALIHQMTLKEREHAQSKLLPNPKGNMTQTLVNDRYNMVPGAVG